MTTIVGGLRSRLIRESCFEMVRGSLTQLGWFDPTRPHLPVTFESRQQTHEEPIIPNTAALSDENLTETDWELGSQLAEHTWQMYIDFYADNDAIGLHFIRDVQDILRGRISAIGRTQPNFAVYDFRQATPPLLFFCDLERVVVDKSHGFLKPWLLHWYSCSFEIIDYYATDAD